MRTLFTFNPFTDVSAARLRRRPETLGSYMRLRRICIYFSIS